MKKFLPNAISTFLLAAILLMSYSGRAQMEFRLFTDFNTGLSDVNNEGFAIAYGQTYDFQTDSFTPVDPNAVGMAYTNNNGDISGYMFFDEPNFVLQPAYKSAGGDWTAIGWFPASDPYTDFVTTYGISPNGQYVVGQMSTGGGVNFGTFLYDTTTGTLSEFWDPNGEALAGYDVNDEGVIVGWVDIPGASGTNRTPAYFDSSGITVIVNPQNSALSAAYNINSSNIIVGDSDDRPFIYDMSTDTFQDFNIPTGYSSASFNEISENGIAFGYAQAGFGEREAIVYHPQLGSQPILLKDILADNGIVVNTFDGRMGTGTGISEDGNFVVGRDNGFPFTTGWILDFNDMLIQQTTCSIDCPADIVVDLDPGNYTAVVNYDVTFDCGGNPPAGTEIILVDGLPSGEEFPLGETFLYFELVDGNGDLLDSCSMTITVNDFFCTGDYITLIEPISYVEFAGIANESSPNPPAPANEYFFDIDPAEVQQGESYPIAVEGNTGGNFVDHITVFIDWNQDYQFNTTDEMYEIGTIENSTGTDGIQAVNDITVPLEALVGTTRMRIVKNWDVSQTDPCGIFDYGQSEDYLVNVTEASLGINDLHQQGVSMFPNPSSDFVNLLSTDVMNDVQIFDLTGKLILSNTLEATQSTVNISNLTSGIYLINIQTHSGNHSLQLIKK